MAKPTSETPNLSEADRRRLARIVVIHEIAVVLLQWADELRLHEPGAHLTMAMHALQKECPELLDPAAALLRGLAIDTDG
ncbi:MAG TPA: hypothetical protein VF605_03075 [Allosphingosinicella sp.]|jgi:hypothetical protein